MCIARSAIVLGIVLAGAAMLRAEPLDEEAVTQQPEEAANPPAADAAADAAIRKKIARCRRAAENLKLDGLDRDWEDLPQLTDKRGDAKDDDSRDIRAVAIAPTEKYLWVMIRTVGAPSSAPWSFYVYIDLVGDQSRQFRIELPALGKPPEGNVPGEGGRFGKAKPLQRSVWMVRKVVEMRIDYRDLAAILSKEEAAMVADAGVRPWVRVGVETWDAKSRKIVDRGPSVASYRLVADEFPLDTPLKEMPRSGVPIEFPLRGRWYVSQGPFGSVSHAKMWAYDFVRLDEHGRTASPPHSEDVDDYHSYKEDILSPVDGVVRVARGAVPDSPVMKKLDPTVPVNEVYIKADDGFGVALVHLAPKSLAVKVDEAVVAGQLLALVGNSGASDAPHLHMSLWGGLFRRTSAPANLRNVRVGLNPTDDDPWARDLKAWSPRQGYFCARQTPWP